jgi:hypothetical protein
MQQDKWPVNAESYAVRLKNEAIESRLQGLLGNFVWQQAVVRYLEEFAVSNSTREAASEHA